MIKLFATDVDGTMTDACMYYAENGIEFSTPNGSLCKFTEYKASEFPKFKSGELQIENCVVIGKYPIRENSIQKDFNSMLEKNEIVYHNLKRKRDKKLYGFKLENVEKIDPIEVNGKLSLWEYDYK